MPIETYVGIEGICIEGIESIDDFYHILDELHTLLMDFAAANPNDKHNDLLNDFSGYLNHISAQYDDDIEY